MSVRKSISSVSLWLIDWLAGKIQRMCAQHTDTLFSTVSSRMFCSQMKSLARFCSPGRAMISNGNRCDSLPKPTLEGMPLYQMAEQVRDIPTVPLLTYHSIKYISHILLVKLPRTKDLTIVGKVRQMRNRTCRHNGGRELKNVWICC